MAGLIYEMLSTLAPLTFKGHDLSRVQALLSDAKQREGKGTAYPPLEEVRNLARQKGVLDTPFGKHLRHWVAMH